MCVVIGKYARTSLFHLAPLVFRTPTPVQTDAIHTHKNPETARGADRGGRVYHLVMRQHYVFVC